MSSDAAVRTRILLVEDNETIRHAFRILLEDSGYEVIEAASGEDALRCADEELPDLILLDLGLPDVGGLEVTRRIRSSERTREIVVIALTGRALETDEDACLAAGCTAYLSKPIDSAGLLRKIGEHLGEARS
jgi:two-component system cell cycle response regulator DivK